jgi:uncharacterized protein with von Willebrand factor type A (vWA) domain
MKPFHFFASSALEWRIHSNIKSLIKLMDKLGDQYRIWYVPLDITAPYDIENYRPVVDNLVYLGRHDPKGGEQ